MRFYRDDYIAGRCTHREYYAQYVTDEIRALVRDRIGEARIRSSVDAHFNDIPLHLWDSLDLYIGAKEATRSPNVKYRCAAFSVCVFKEAARQIKEEG